MESVTVPLLTPPAALVFAAGADAVAEVLEWANDGVGADQSACTWLALLRVGQRIGLPLTSSAPPQLSRDLDDDVDAALSAHPVSPNAAAEAFPRLAASLRTDRMGTRSHPLKPTEVNPELTDDSALLRALPLALIEHLDPETVYAMALENTAITVTDVAEQHRTAALVGTLASALTASSAEGVITTDDLGASLATPLARGEASEALPSGRLLTVTGEAAWSHVFAAMLSEHIVPEGDPRAVVARAMRDGVASRAVARLLAAVNP